jgi:large subunit ribosomal protein L13
VVTYTGYPGGKEKNTPKKLLARKPTYLLEESIRGYVAENPPGRAMFSKLHVYAGEKHDHVAQTPKPAK